MNTDKLFDKLCKIIANDSSVTSIRDLMRIAGYSKKTFYNHFPVGSDRHEEITDLLHSNRSEIKMTLRRKWLETDNATLQIALYKLLATPEELQALSSVVKVDDSKAKPEIKIENFAPLKADNA